MMLIQSVTKMQYNVAGGIDCLIQFETQPDRIPFTASAEDIDEFGAQLYKQLMAGEWGDIAPFSLMTAKAIKSSEIIAECRQNIMSGFYSDALGERFSYPSDETSQLNLNASVLSSILPSISLNWTTPFLCCDDAGNWSYRQHTAAQIQQAGTDCKSKILACLTKKEVLLAKIAAATSLEEITALTW